MDRSHAFLLVCMAMACAALMSKKDVDSRATRAYAPMQASLGPDSAFSIAMERYEEGDLYPGSTVAAQLATE